jgi:hypothetical protein
METSGIANSWAVIARVYMAIPQEVIKVTTSMIAVLSTSDAAENLKYWCHNTEGIQINDCSLLHKMVGLDHLDQPLSPQSSSSEAASRRTESVPKYPHGGIMSIVLDAGP